MAVVDFIPRYRSKPSFGRVRKMAANAQFPSFKYDKFRIHCYVRRLAHVTLCTVLFLSLIVITHAFERIQAYIAPYLG